MKLDRLKEPMLAAAGGGLMACLCLALLVSLVMPSEAMNTVQALPKTVQVSSVVLSDSRTAYRFYGLTQKESRSVLSFTMGGRVVSRPVEVGHQVKGGDQLATLDQLAMSNQVAVAYSRLTEIQVRLAQVDKGLDVGDLRTGGESIPIRVRSGNGEDTAPEDLVTLDVSAPGTSPVSLMQVADAGLIWRPSAIVHHNR